MSTSKTCTKCQEVKAVGQFIQRKETKDGLSSWCKSCMAEYNKNRRASEEYKTRERVWGKRASKKLQQDPERKKRKNARESKRLTVKYHDIKENNPEQWKKILRKINDRKTVRRKTDPAYQAWERAQHYKRKALKSQNGGKFTKQEWIDLCSKYGNVCLCCGEQNPLTVDHITPLSKGGANIIDNIQPLCSSCNSSKGTKVIDYRLTFKGPS